MGYNTMNQAHGRRDGINWATVALYGGGAAVGVGAIKAGISGGKNAWSKHNMTTKMNRIAGLPSGGMAGAQRGQYAQAGADFLGRMGIGSTKGYKSNPMYQAQLAETRTGLSQARRGGSMSPRAMNDLRSHYRGQMNNVGARIRSQSILGGEGMSGGMQRGAAAATGWLGAFDYAGQSMKRAGVAGARAGMVGLGMKAAGAGLGWLFD